MASQMKEKIIIAFDGEFSGPFGPKTYMVAFGAVAFNVKSGEMIDQFFGAMTPPTSAQGFDAECEKQFWSQPKMQKLLAMFKLNAKHPDVVMPEFLQWIENLQKTYQLVTICVDCPTDATWLDYYLTHFANSQPLVTFGDGTYKGWPMVVDDFYRGMLGRPDLMWGMQDALSGHLNTGFSMLPPPSIPSTPHHPVSDAFEIGRLFLEVLRYSDSKTW